MMQRSTLIIILVFLVTFSGCQSYTQGLQQSLARADETAALSALKTIALAQRTYSITNSGEYGTLKQLGDGGFLDARYAEEKAVKDYVITCAVTPKTSGGPEGSLAALPIPTKQVNAPVDISI